MVNISHDQAHDLIHSAADGLLSAGRRAELDHHLAGCDECRAYADEIELLEQHLTRTLQRRWPLPAHSNQEMSWVLKNVRSKTIGQRPITRIANRVLRPAFSFGAIAILLATMAWAIGSVANKSITQPGDTTETPLPSSPPGVGMITGTPAISAGSGVCELASDSRSDVHEKPDPVSPIVGMLEIGQSSSVSGQYVDKSAQVWFLTSSGSTTGWVQNDNAVVIRGDCSSLALYIDGSEPGTLVTVTPAFVPTPSPTSTPRRATPRPPTATPAVCDVVAPDNIPLYAGPGTEYAAVGTLASGTEIPVLGWIPGEGNTTWLKVGYNGVEQGWVAWQNVDMAQLCPFISKISETRPTPTSAEPCLAQALVDTPISTGPGSEYTIIGKLTAGQTAPISGMFYQENYGTWLQIAFQDAPAGWVPAELNGVPYTGSSGNCANVPFVDVQPHPATYTPTPTLDVTATVTPQPTTMICTGTVKFQVEVFANPAYSSQVVGTVHEGDAVTITDAYYGGDANDWFRIEYSGGSGWISATWTISLDANCGNIPPTPIPPLSVPIDYTASVGLDVGSTSQFTQTLPGSNGDRAHVIAVKVTGIPPGNSDSSYYRTVRMQVGCSGPSASTLRWGYYGNASLIWSCGQYIDVNMGMGWDSQYYVFEIPPDGNATYTINLTVNPYQAPS